ncbi:MAG: phosphatase PAP2 family protein [Parasporobacterium sp.]|nr:phosphatase PAP2 family protein [Parasporobacterium sp.]
MGIILASTAIADWLNTNFAGFDMAIFKFFGGIQSDIGTFIARLFTSMGATIYAVLFLVLALVLVLFKRTRKVGLALVFAIVIGTLITNIILKPMVMRIRPYNALQNVGDFLKWYIGAGAAAESDFCFPSGHTCAATEIAIVLCAVHFSGRKKGICWIFPVVAFLTGCSRIYLMVHYPSDVLASLVIGLVAGIAGYYISKLICYILDRTGLDDRLDLERVHVRRRGRHITRGAAGLAIATAWLIIFMVSFVKIQIESGEQYQSTHPRCAYDQEYKCYNEAQTGKNYPAIDGKYYCKIHWKELSK